MRRLPTSFLDLFLLLLTTYVVLFILSVLLISKEDKETSVEDVMIQDRGIVVSIEWPTEDNSDVDLWASRQSNKESLTGYMRRENDVFVLSNDNTSSNYGAVGDKKLEFANENIYIQNAVPDRYHISLHGYNIRTQSRTTDVKVLVYQSKPYRKLVEQVVTVTSGQESPVCSFRIDQNNKVVDIETDPTFLPKIIKRK